MIARINEFSIEAVRDALQKLDRFDNLCVNGLDAFRINEIEKIDSLLFKEIEEKIRTDRWYPSVGMWLNENNKISEEKLIRNILYSVNYFIERFDKRYRVFQGEKIYNSFFPQALYSGKFDAAVLTDEKENFWLDSADNSRILIAGEFETTDINDIDEDYITTHEFTSYEQAVSKILSTKLELKTVKTENNISEMSDIEKLLVEAEIISTQQEIDKSEEIKSAWISLFLGEEKNAKVTAGKIISTSKVDNSYIKINSDNIKLLSFKFSEDNKDKIIRIKETAGKEKSINIICDKINAGFRCETEPYELQTFRIDSDGFVKETFITE